MILVNGRPEDTLPVTDSVVLRGDGVFEALRTRDGRAFALTEHVRRLEASASAVDLSVPDRHVLFDWVDCVAIPEGDGIVRILVTRGDATIDQRVVVMSHDLPAVPDRYSIVPHPAPWHPAGRAWELAGVKTLSYAPNLAASRAAHRQGFDDALLVSDEGVVLEGPTFAVGWFIDGRFQTPSLDLGILASITRQQALEVAHRVGFPVDEGVYHVEALESATDMVVLSTVKQVTPVRRCGDLRPAVTEITRRLQDGFTAYMSERLDGPEP